MQGFKVRYTIGKLAPKVLKGNCLAPKVLTLWRPAEKKDF